MPNYRRIFDRLGAGGKGVSWNGVRFATSKSARGESDWPTTLPLRSVYLLAESLKRGPDCAAFGRARKLLALT